MMLERRHPDRLYRATPEWVPTILEFLSEVAEPQLPHPVNWRKVGEIVASVVGRSTALMALDSYGHIQSSIGLAVMYFWWCDKPLLGNVWFFTREGSHAGAMLLREAARIAKAADMELHIQSEKRRSLTIFNNPGW